jgi:type IV secretory pathway VirB9-like protein
VREKFEQAGEPTPVANQRVENESKFQQWETNNERSEMDNRVFITGSKTYLSL